MKSILSGLCCLFLAFPAMAQQAGKKASEKRLERVSGHYKLVKIEENEEKDVSIHFLQAEGSDSRFEKLVLRTDQTQLGLQEGQVFRLSAEVLAGTGKEFEITQVLLFLPSHEFGAVPVWLLSSQFGPQDIRGARWIEMHAPQADYRIF